MVLYEDKFGTCWMEEDIERLSPLRKEELGIHPLFDEELFDD